MADVIPCTWQVFCTEENPAECYQAEHCKAFQPVYNRAVFTAVGRKMAVNQLVAHTVYAVKCPPDNIVPGVAVPYTADKENNKQVAQMAAAAYPAAPQWELDIAGKPFRQADMPSAPEICK